MRQTASQLCLRATDLVVYKTLKLAARPLEVAIGIKDHDTETLPQRGKKNQIQL